VVEFDRTPAWLIGAEGCGWNVLRRVLDLAAVALAAEQAGGAQAALDMSVAYLRTRVQFGQPTGAFQALKHMAADVFVEVESAKSAAYYGSTPPPRTTRSCPRPPPSRRRTAARPS
jgi:alkylation response protein AidB-like acyl-CoA dehydrogenase